MKIIFITDGLYPFVIGGMQKHAAYVIRQFAGTGHHVHIISADYNHVPLDEFRAKILGNIKDENISLELIPFPVLPAIPGHYIIASRIFARRAAQLARTHLSGVDLVYCKGFTGWYLAQHKKPGDPPVVSQLHGLEMFQKPYGLKDCLSRWMLRFPATSVIRNSDAILSYGGKVREILLRLGKKPGAIFEQYGAVDDFWLQPEPQPKVNEKVRNFLFVARYEYRKGYHILKPVLEKLIAESLPFRITLVGEIPEPARILHENIRYAGNLKAEEIRAMAEESEVLVLPSLAEGFPTILVEAMARGLAPIAADTGAVSVVANPQNGWLIEPGNTDALYSAMKDAILMDSATLAEKQKKSRELISRDFNWNSMFNVLVSHLNSIIHDHRNRIAGQKP